ncbi:MAG: ABC transporter ATP-binding protein [Candidatus Kapaibacterium sp.]
MTKIICENINKVYPGDVHAVRNANFTVNDGEFLVLVGPSGCGKSTILRMIAGLEEISSGRLYFDGRLMNDVEPRGRDVGMVFQNYALYPHMSVFDNIAFPLQIKRVNRSVIKARVDEAAALLGLENYLGRKPKELSGGQRQRVALGRAIIRDPGVFLFDEPLSNLDAMLRVQMRAEIIRLHRKLGTTAVYVTHDQVEAMTMGSRLVVLKEGEIRQIAPPEEIYSHPADMFTAEFIGSPKINFFKINIIAKDNTASLKFVNGDELPADMKLPGVESVVMGIRPEHIYINGNESGLKSRVVNIENLGHEFLLYFDYHGIVYCARMKDRPEYGAGDNIWLSFDAEKLHFFDENGKRMNNDFD